MAIVRNLEKIAFDVPGKHSEVCGTYAVVVDGDGEKFLQIDTYGSSDRQIKGKKSQSMRFSADAIAQLSTIIKKHF